MPPTPAATRSRLAASAIEPTFNGRVNSCCCASPGSGRGEACLARRLPVSASFNDSLNGSLMHNGATFTFTAPGAYSYHCSAHPYMTATIIVTA